MNARQRLEGGRFRGGRWEKRGGGGLAGQGKQKRAEMRTSQRCQRGMRVTENLGLSEEKRTVSIRQR